MSIWVFVIECIIMITVFGIFVFGLLLISPLNTCFLDWILFANIRRIRLPGTEHMEKEYHQKWFHVKVILPMLPVFVAVGAVSAFLMTWIW